MPLYEQIAQSIVRRRKDQLINLSSEDRRAVVGNIVTKLSEKSEDELISFMSAQEGKVDPALQEQIEYIKEETDPEDLELERKVYLGSMEQRAKLQSLGVKTGEVPPAGDIERGFGVDPIKSITSSLTEHFGQPVTVFTRKPDNKFGDEVILYIDPTDNVVKEAAKGVASLVGTAFPIVGDVAGTIGGGIAGGAISKTPGGVIAGETAGAGLVTGMAEFSRLWIGKALGVHDLSYGEMAKKAGLQGAEAAAATGITGGIVATGKGLRNFLKGRVFTKDAALRSGMTSQEADAVLAEVNKILGPQGEVRATLFKKTQEVGAGAMEAEVRKNIKHAENFIARDIADQKALTKALDIVTKPTAAKAGTGVRQVIEKQVSAKIKAARDIVSRNTTELETQMRNLSKLSKETVGEPTRKLILEKSAAAQRAVDSQWAKTRDIGGFNEASKTYGIGITKGPETLKKEVELALRAKTAVTQTERAGTGGIFTKTSGKPKPIVKELPRGKITFRPKEKPQPVQDLENFNKELSGLRKKQRQLAKGVQFADLTSKDLNEVISSMIADRKLLLTKMGRGDLLKQIEKAEESSRKFHQIFNRSVVGDLTEKTEAGVFKIRDKDFVDNMLKADSEEVKQFMAVIGDNPKLITQWKQGVSDVYKRDVLDKIKPLQGRKLTKPMQTEIMGKVNAWIDKNAETLSQFFTKEEIAGFRKTGGLSILVKKQTKQLESIISNARTKFGRGKLLALDPDSMVKFVTNNTGSFVTPLGRGVQTATNKIKYLKGVTKNYPGAWKGFQDEFSSSLKRDLIHPESGQINSAAISKMISERGGVIKEIMGDEYLKNLKTISDTSQILARTAKSLTKDERDAVIKQVIRGTAAPPLSKKGRIFTALLIFDRKKAHDVVAKALLDPIEIRKVAQLAEHKRLTRETLEIAASLGLMKYLEEDLE